MRHTHVRARGETQAPGRGRNRGLRHVRQLYGARCPITAAANRSYHRYHPAVENHRQDGSDSISASSADSTRQIRSARKCVDIERTKAIYSRSRPALLRLDANQGWTAKQAVYALQSLEDAGVMLELVEQPVKAQDLDGLKYVTDRVHTPIMADESVFGPAQVIELIRLRAADIINIKLMKTGGISNAIRIADIAALYGVECMIGCMLESSISVAAAVHVAVAKATSSPRSTSTARRCAPSIRSMAASSSTNRKYRSPTRPDSASAKSAVSNRSGLSEIVSNVSLLKIRAETRPDVGDRTPYRRLHPRDTHLLRDYVAAHWPMRSVSASRAWSSSARNSASRAIRT